MSALTQQTSTQQAISVGGAAGELRLLMRKRERKMLEEAGEEDWEQRVLSDPTSQSCSRKCKAEGKGRSRRHRGTHRKPPDVDQRSVRLLEWLQCLLFAPLRKATERIESSAR